MADRSKDIHVLAAPIGWRLNNLSGALGRFAYLRCWLDSRCRAGSGRFGSRVAAVAACCLAAPAARRPLFGHRKNLPIARSRMDPDSSGGLREFDSWRSARPTSCPTASERRCFISSVSSANSHSTRARSASHASKCQASRDATALSVWCCRSAVLPPSTSSGLCSPAASARVRGIVMV